MPPAHAIAVVDEPGGPVRHATVAELLVESGFAAATPASSRKSCEHDYVFAGYHCCVAFDGSHHTAYVDATAAQLQAPGVYEPHGGFTAHNGFDCSHVTDVTLSRRRLGETFKSHAFAASEIRRVAESLPPKAAAKPRAAPKPKPKATARLRRAPKPGKK